MSFKCVYFACIFYYYIYIIHSDAGYEYLILIYKGLIAKFIIQIVNNVESTCKQFYF